MAERLLDSSFISLQYELLLLATYGCRHEKVRLVYGIVFGILILSGIVKISVRSHDWHCYLKTTKISLIELADIYYIRRMTYHDSLNMIIARGYSTYTDAGYVCMHKIPAYNGSYTSIKTYNTIGCQIYSAYGCSTISNDLYMTF